MDKAGGSSPEEQVMGILRRHGPDPSLLLPILQEVQERFHQIPSQVEDAIAAHLSLPRSHVEGVVDFYHFLSHERRGEYDILLSNCIIDRLRMVSLIESRVPLEQWPDSMFRVDDNVRHPGPLLKSGLTPGEALNAALGGGPENLLQQLEQSGLRGRGGAGFPTGMKWRLCREAAGEHYLVCNADEGEPGTFKDRELLRLRAHALFEGMTLGAWVTGAQKGFLYLRGEYRFLREALDRILDERRNCGLLGESICGVNGFRFDITIRMGADAYICGEESALLESLEGNRPRPRNRPPYPITSGFRGKPTLVNNVETFVAAAFIALYGSSWLNSIGTDASPGSKLLSISGDCARPGIYEFPFGTPVEEILEACGADSPMGVQVGGPSGSYITPQEFHRRLAFEDLSTGGSFMVFGRERDPLEIVENFTAFFAHESCGFCTPCRVGTAMQNRLLKKIQNGEETGTEALDVLRQLRETMIGASHCGLGRSGPLWVCATTRGRVR